MNPSTNNTIISPYLLSSVFNSRYHQHLNHLNDMAFTHTKILQEIMEKRSIEPMASSPHGSISSSSSTSSSTIDSIQQQQRKRSYPCIDNNDIKHDNHKRPRKQSKPQQVLKIDKNEQSQSSDEEEMGEINNQHDHKPIEKQVFFIISYSFSPNLSMIFRLFFQFYHLQCYHLDNIISHF